MKPARLCTAFLFLWIMSLGQATAKDTKIAPADSTPTITGDVTFILAAKSPEHMDRRLLPLRKDLKKAFSPHFKRFEYINAVYPRLVLNQPKVISMPGGGKMKVTYLGKSGKFLKMKLELPEWTGKVSTKNGKRFFQAGRKYRDGILAISIRMHATR